MLRWIHLLFLISVGLCLTSGGCQKEQSVVTPDASHSADSISDPQGDIFDFTALRGNWLIVAGDGEQSGKTVQISDETTYHWELPSGLSVAVVFEPSAAAPPGLVYLSFESAEDTEELGGGGPRKGIARSAANGEVEIVVSSSAVADYPSGDAASVPAFKLRKQ